MTSNENLQDAQRRLERHYIELGNVARQARTSWDRSEILKPPKRVWTPHLAVLLAGVYKDDSYCILSKLKGHEESVISTIYAYAFGFVWENWKTILAPDYKRFVHNTVPAVYFGESPTVPKAVAEKLQATCDDRVRVFPVYVSPARVGSPPDPNLVRVNASDHYRPANCAFTKCGTISFPTPSGIDVNMLPFIMGEKTSLPDELQKYYDPLVAQCPLGFDEMGKVCYLSITERFITKGDTQRRGGLHLEAPIHRCSFRPGNTFRARWGGGTMGKDLCQGGIFMASSVSNTCAIYDALIDQQTTDSHGGMEHLRPLLNAPYLIPANELIWMTDRTPHQAVPQPDAGYRQFFRLVTSGLNVWHEQNCTANPKVPLPEHVRVIRQSRFEDEYNNGDCFITMDDDGPGKPPAL